MRLRLAIVLALLGPATADAQPKQQQPPTWQQMPRMQLERQFAGPLQDTVVQRWRDPADGTVCYIYLPITAAHSAPAQSGYVQYGPNTIGSISCYLGANSALPSAQIKRSKPGPPPVAIAPPASKDE